MKKEWSLLIFVLFLIVESCTKDETFKIGEDLVEVKSSFITIDTITINTYTVKADSIKTTGFNLGLAGNFSDGSFGKINASTYFQVALPTSLTLEDRSRLDSICVILKPTGYCYGDSTKPYNLTVYKLQENLTNTEISSRYNVSKVSIYEDEPLGSISKVIRPHSGKELTIKLNDSFSQNFFNLILNESEEFESQDKFTKYLKGLALVSDSLKDSPVLQFTTKDSSSIMRIYYHTGRTENTLDFDLYNTAVQYNRFNVNYSNSKLNALKKQKDMLKSKETNNETYCQAGTGIRTRIEFPYLKNLFQTYTASKILKAELIIKPVKKSFALVPLPSNVYLYSTNTLNDLGSLLINASKTTISPVLYQDPMYNETSYTYDITYYLSSIINNLKDDAPALLLSFQDTESGASLDRLIIGDYYHDTNAIRLKITYWKY
jgi:hypothetical protein